MIFGIDVLSDLNLTETSNFNWEGKPTSLYCVLAGNISSDLHVLYKTVKHLSKLYQGVFYIDGSLENSQIDERDRVIDEISKLFTSIKNAVYLHNNVVVVDSVALVGVNGWYGNTAVTDGDTINLKINRYDDLAYLQKTIEKLQLHVDVKQILVISNSIPTVELYFGEKPDIDPEEINLNYVLESDTESKITTWVFGTHKKIVDSRINRVNYYNNPCYNSNPYYPKRVNLEI
jgi:predicted phosphohydrolase